MVHKREERHVCVTAYAEEWMGMEREREREREREQGQVGDARVASVQYLHRDCRN
jgi:hypothetical protein